MASSLPRKLWEPSAPERTEMFKFKNALAQAKGKKLESFHDLFDYSIKNKTEFWDFLWKYSNFIHEGSYTRVVDETARMDSVPAWFSGVRLNFAENLLYSAGGDATRNKEDDKVAVTAITELGLHTARHVTWGALRQKTGRLAQALRASGVVRGTRVAACACNSLDTLVVMLATTALGAIFTSCSTDLGVNGILERLQQVEPRWLFMDDTAVYNGKTTDLRDKMADVVNGMDGVDAFQGVVAMPYRGDATPRDLGRVPKAHQLDAFLGRATSDRLEFERIDFRDPFVIVYSSGTTGRPKCIVHSLGGVLLTAYKEGALHQGFGPSSVVLQYTTTSWIMYLAAVQVLTFGCRTVLYDGSPFLPSQTVLLEVVEQERVTHLGISPRYMQELQRASIKPREKFNLDSLQVVISTGMVLPEELFHWFYDAGFPVTARLNNITGGTDLAGCFGIGNPLTPVYAGGCASLSLGMNVQVYDTQPEGSHVKGSPVQDGVAGELVTCGAFPNMPAMFWGVDGAERYHKAYFARFDDVWTHGDFVVVNPQTKQFIVIGRSDGVLNPSGVRFGSAEIYTVIEKHFADEVADSICIGQRRPGDGDEKVLLFLLPKQGVAVTAELVQRVKSAIKEALSARHVPAYVFPTPDIPTTINGKKVELPVKQIVSGARVEASGTLANPASLDYFYQFVNIEDAVKRESKL